MRRTSKSATAGDACDRRVGAVLLLASFALSTGCAAYWQKRGQDLADAVYCHGGIGYGVEAHASLVSCLAQVGLGGHRSLRGGLDGWQHGTWEETQIVAAIPLLLGLYDVRRPSHGDGLCETPSYYSCAGGGFGNRFVVGPEVGLFLGFVGFEAGVDIVKLLDFVTGFCGLDMCGDDVVDIERVRGEEWHLCNAFAGSDLRVFVTAIRQMTTQELVAFIPSTRCAARYLVFKELVRRQAPGRIDIMLRHFEFHWFNTNEARLAHRLLRAEGAALPRDALRARIIEKLDPDGGEYIMRQDTGPGFLPLTVPREDLLLLDASAVGSGRSG